MKPIGVYVRVSSRSGRDDDRFHSPREQAERARGLCYAQGLEPGPVFEDIDVSGAILPAERPAMSRLLDSDPGSPTKPHLETHTRASKPHRHPE